MTLDEAQQQGIAPWDDVIEVTEHVQVYRDRYPVTPGHRLYVPISDNPLMIHRAMADAQMDGDLMVTQGRCDGYNIGLNMGTAAGQTVMYPHVHLIPRRSGDCEDPVGGVRGVIPGQANYRKETYSNPVIPL